MNSNLSRLIERQVERTPDAIAVELQGQSLSYRALNEQANGLAALLHDSGIGPDCIVGLHMGRSLQLMVAVLATLKAGAAYLPLDPQYPRERLEYMAADAGLHMLVHDADVVPLKAPAAMPFRAPRIADNPVHQAGPANLAYVLYTSGSTGQPKGVEIEHRSVVNFVESMAGLLDFSPSEVVVSVTGLTFDIAGLDLFLTWTQGARLVLVPRATVFDGPRLAQAVKECGATLLQTTPVTWRSMLAAGWSAPPGFKALCGGEAMPQALFNDLLQQPVRLWNLYGPTETTIWSTAAEFRQGDTDITVGHPILNTQVHILEGEVCIGGAGLARGYRHRPDLTAQKFVATEHGRLYRTGDLGRLRPDGALELLGRQDHQIKWHGYRIEPGEVEAALRQVTGVRECVVGLRNIHGESRLVAWLVTPEPRSQADIPAALADILPVYMIPSSIVCVPRLPLTMNDKIDRNALPDPVEVETEAPC